jgi:hypothetical protein
MADVMSGATVRAAVGRTKMFLGFLQALNYFATVTTLML